MYNICMYVVCCISNICKLLHFFKKYILCFFKFSLSTVTKKIATIFTQMSVNFIVIC